MSMSDRRDSSTTSREDIRELIEAAGSYRRAMITVGITMAIGVVMFLVLSRSGMDNPPAALAVGVVALLPLAIWFQVELYRTMKTMGYEAAWVWNVAGVVSAVAFPPLFIVFLVVWSTVVNGWFGKRQVKVGLLGPKRDSLDERVRELQSGGALKAQPQPVTEESAASGEEYVRTARGSGMSDAEIVTALTAAGWSVEQAEEAVGGG